MAINVHLIIDFGFFFLGSCYFPRFIHMFYFTYAIFNVFSSVFLFSLFRSFYFGSSMMFVQGTLIVCQSSLIRIPFAALSLFRIVRRSAFAILIIQSIHLANTMRMNFKRWSLCIDQIISIKPIVHRFCFTFNFRPLVGLDEFKRIDKFNSWNYVLFFNGMISSNRKFLMKWAKFFTWTLYYVKRQCREEQTNEEIKTMPWVEF